MTLFKNAAGALYIVNKNRLIFFSDKPQLQLLDFRCAVYDKDKDYKNNPKSQASSLTNRFPVVFQD